ncbi:MAG: hypothetical protein NC421_02010 [Lachnospiraceae bacterium]|nr:hypothetical protein [Lachnospiraceae bacterium]
MNDKVFVNGGVLIMTPFFRHKNGGCRFSHHISSEIIEPNGDIDGYPCLIITENAAPTIFKGYFAKTFFTSKYTWAPFFSNTVDQCLQEFNCRIDEIMELIETSTVKSPTVKQTLYRMSLTTAISALDTWVSDIVLYTVTKDSEAFLKICKIVIPANKSNDMMVRLLKMWNYNAIDSVEQEIIDLVLKKSYSNMSEIKTIIKLLYGIIIDKNESVEDSILKRHLIVHRSGRRKNGDIIEFSKEEIVERICLIKCFVNKLSSKIPEYPQFY